MTPATLPRPWRPTACASFAIFSTGDLVALDLEGNQVWAKNVGVPDKSLRPFFLARDLRRHPAGPIRPERKQFFTGLDVATGQARWRTPRDFGASWSSPALLVNTGERDEVILAADPDIVSYDPKNGKEFWRAECLERAEVARRRSTRTAWSTSPPIIPNSPRSMSRLTRSFGKTRI